jgi:hypothetical protein
MIRAGRRDSGSFRVGYYRKDEKIIGGLDQVGLTVPTCPAMWPRDHHRHAAVYPDHATPYAVVPHHSKSWLMAIYRSESLPH